MDQASLERALVDVPLGAIRYVVRTGSSNDDLVQWAAAGAPDLALLVAGEQTAGRGRGMRRWYTLPGEALAFSLLLREPGKYIPASLVALSRFTALGAQAVCDALWMDFDLHAQIKWPNDVLVENKKVAGILAEAQWLGDQVASIVVGIGVNVFSRSVPPEELLNFPATSIQAALDARKSQALNSHVPLDRLTLLRAVLVHLLAWRERLVSPEFMLAWESRLAYRGEWVQLIEDGSPPVDRRVRLLGLASDGALIVFTEDGREQYVYSGEIHLRP